MGWIKGKSICENCKIEFEWKRSDKVVRPRCCSHKCWGKVNTQNLRSFNEKRFRWSNANEKEKLERKKSLFDQKVIKKEGCWDWKGSIYKNGYGFIPIHENGKKFSSLAHRLSYELHIGPIPEGFIVCHRCDNPKCTNPDHLWIGTTQDNVDDKIRKGRSNKGQKHGNSKLKDEDIPEIRKMLDLGVSGAKLARKYNVSTTIISYIKNRKTWTHVK